MHALFGAGLELREGRGEGAVGLLLGRRGGGGQGDVQLQVQVAGRGGGDAALFEAQLAAALPAWRHGDFHGIAAGCLDLDGAAELGLPGEAVRTWDDWCAGHWERFVPWPKPHRSRGVPDFEAVGCEPFRPFGGDKAMNYWTLPLEALEDPDEMTAWTTRALDAALRATTGKQRGT